MSGLKKHAVFSVFLLLASLAGLKQVSLQAQTLDEKALKGMKWRQIGPFRGGRALAVTGVAGDPETYYFGAVAGGVKKVPDTRPPPHRQGGGIGDVFPRRLGGGRRGGAKQGA